MRTLQESMGLLSPGRVQRLMARWLPQDYRDTAASLLGKGIAHQRLYVKDDSAFNEGFATAVETLGMERWFEARGDPAGLSAYEAGRRRSAAFNLLLDFDFIEKGSEAGLLLLALAGLGYYLFRPLPHTPRSAVSTPVCCLVNPAAPPTRIVPKSPTMSF